MRAFLIALAVLCGTLAAGAEERIISFDSRVAVQKDGTVEVTETIEVVTGQIDIKHGIFRDFPTQYKDRRGMNVRVGFGVTDVRRNGREEPYEVESIARGKRIRIGSADVYLPSGKYIYTINYRTTRQIGFFQDFDELYWNVTGNGWMFPIEKASVSIYLPQEAAIKQSAAYTGAFGSTGRDFRILGAEGNYFSAQTTRRLNPYEGFTVAAAWQKGVIVAPDDMQKTLWMLEDNAAFFLLLFSIAIVGGYYLYAWNAVGRDPDKGQIIPRFKPPENLGPAATRFVWRQGYDERTFAAAIVGLASLGRMKISEDDGEFTIKKIEREGAAATAPESAVYESLGGAPLALKKSNRERVVALTEALESALDKTYVGVMFNRNRIWFWAGAVLSIVCLLLSALALPEGDRENALFYSAFCAIFGSVVLGMVWGNIKLIAQSRGIVAKIVPVFLLLFLVPFSFPFILPIVMTLKEQSVSPGMIAYFAGALMMACMNLVFLNLLYAPTKAGRWLMDEIEGFRMYLTTAEQGRLNALNPPEKTPELFERFLPFAIALDCENEWGKKFEGVLAAASATNKNYSPSWYSGSSWNSNNVGAFTGVLSSTLVSNVVSASASSSSGSGGGGSSGGGGGGGGGGGW